MADIVAEFRSQLAAALAERGARAEFVRTSGVARTQLERWLSSESNPTLESLESVARALGREAWTLIKPGGADLISPDAYTAAIESKDAMIARLERDIRRLDAALEKFEAENEALRHELKLTQTKPNSRASRVAAALSSPENEEILAALEEELGLADESASGSG